MAALNRPLDVVRVEDGVIWHEETSLREVIAGGAGDKALNFLEGGPCPWSW